MSSKRAIFRKKTVSGFRWLCVFLFLYVAYWGVMTNFVVRDFWDPPFVAKSELLQERIKQYPGHPLWLVMGSSRVDEGLCPGVLADRMKDANAPLVFNFGMGGVDLYRQLVSLRRLVAGGLKPQRVGIEIVGMLMDRRDEMFADDPRLIVRARADEIAGLCNNATSAKATRGYWLESRLNPFFQYGMAMPNQTLSLRLVPLPFLRRLEPRSYDKWGWFAGPHAPIAPDVYASGLEAARKEYAADLAPGGNFTVVPRFDPLLRECIDYCRNAGIEVFLLRMPEAGDFQAFYPAQANAAIESYLAKVKSEYGVRMIDARSWMPESENFFDGSHLNATGAEIFTRRLADELLKPGGQ